MHGRLTADGRRSLPAKLRLCLLEHRPAVVGKASNRHTPLLTLRASHTRAVAWYLIQLPGNWPAGFGARTRCCLLQLQTWFDSHLRDGTMSAKPGRLPGSCAQQASMRARYPGSPLQAPAPGPGSCAVGGTGGRLPARTCPTIGYWLSPCQGSCQVDNSYSTQPNANTSAEGRPQEGGRGWGVLDSSRSGAWQGFLVRSPSAGADTSMPPHRQPKATVHTMSRDGPSRPAGTAATPGSSPAPEAVVARPPSMSSGASQRGLLAAGWEVASSPPLPAAPGAACPARFSSSALERLKSAT